VYGEIFRGGVDESVKTAVRKSASDYLDKNIFTNYPSPIKAVGFKIFYQHPVWDPSGNVWQYLREMEDLRVIHLRRRNLLKSFVSWKIAQKTDVWKQANNASLELDKRVAISPQECVAFFEQTLQQEKIADERFSGKPLLQTTYESLTSQFSEQMELIQEFLDIDPRPIAMKTAKQNPESLSELIINYDELSHAFSGTRWEAYLA
jgi:LPS sulfotransferase NodH